MSAADQHVPHDFAQKQPEHVAGAPSVTEPGRPTSLVSKFFHNLPLPPSKEERQRNAAPKDPRKIFAGIPLMNWALYWVSFFAWTMDSFDFFGVSLTATRLAEFFDKDQHSLTTSITLTLLFRSLGAVIFGLCGDRYGRKWPLVIDLLICFALQLGTGFCQTFPQFLAIRALFGIAMGGIWGLAASGALENMPPASRGILSGIIQQGYAFGYLIAAVVNLYFVPSNPHTWRSIFWLGAALSFAAAVLRAILPESPAFVAAQAAGGTGQKSKTFLKEAGKAVKLHWWRCIYGVLIMTGFNFFSHGSQDLYPVYLEDAKDLSNAAATRATIISNCGAIAGGFFFGAVSQYLGRRLTIITAVIFAACFIPLWIIPNNFGGLAAGAFFVQFGVQGSWGVVPIYLQECSPAAFRAVYPGLAYQLGNMVASASAQIEATAGETLKTYYKGEERPDYGKIQAILIGVVAGYMVILMLIGPENHAAHFEEAKAATVEGAAANEANGLVVSSRRREATTTEDNDKMDLEKQEDHHTENLHPAPSRAQ